MEQLYEVPERFQLSEDLHTGVNSLFYEGVSYKGRATRIFAYYGIPDSISPDEEVPALILVHGGAGTAYKSWVKEWMARGYAAIAMDLEGHVPYGDEEHTERMEWPSHPWSGPVKQGVFADYEQPVEDQWMYHAVAAVIKAHSLLGSFKGVDKHRVGITGISWGGIITSLVAGLDTRLSFAMPVYGCGYLYEPGSYYGMGFASMPEVDAERIRLLWDPSTYLSGSRLPMLWLNGSNDTHFPLSIFNKSYEEHLNCYPINRHSRLSLHPGLGHSYKDAWTCSEVYAFADSIAKGGPTLTEIRGEQFEGDWFSVHYASSVPILEATLYWCKDDRDWRITKWETIPASLDAINNKAMIRLPKHAVSFFVNMRNEKGWITSTRVMKIRKE
ncbi:alpha/beta hydrolase family protein [Paenibacillus xylanexedens]|uniref:alpha/beta hydrolase family protein n=1 Tax=Paenibacillus xylanexedens TaxID=528191 RepID=UPI0023E84630|nr:acetylxylan esterase [Paenibacillus xylanexedens]